jgi:NNP family nitrate/nitrite transporter-like MFS transporter
MNTLNGISSGQQTKALAISTLAFTVCFAVWTIFSIIGIEIKQNLGLNDTEFGLLVATPVLTGSLSRVFLGIWTDQHGGRLVFFILMLTTSIAVWLASTVQTYQMFLLAALGVGLAGGSFAVGIAYVSKWYDNNRQGTALGVFGMGNVGAAITNFGAPFLLVAYGWENVAKIYAVILFIMALIFWFSTQ